MGFDLDTSVACFYMKLIFFNFYQEVSVVSLTPESSLFCFFFFLFWYSPQQHGSLLSEHQGSVPLHFDLVLLFLSSLFLPWSISLFFFSWKLLHIVGSCPGREPYCICFESSQRLDCSNLFSPPQFRYMVITCFGEKTLWISATILKTGPLYSPVNIR